MQHGILIVEDEPITGRILRQCLHGVKQDLWIVETIAQAEKIAEEKEIDLILLDIQLPDGDGRQLLTKFRSAPATSEIPVFIISSLEGPKVQADCFARGADAYFQKPFDPGVLAMAVLSKLKRSARAVHPGFMDALTGLPNRTAFKNAFVRAAMLASRSQQPLTIGMLDIDRFKAVNDIYGHLEGDRVLQRLASVVSKSLRASDLLSRWGGEEFAVLFPNTTIHQARLALSKASAAFRGELFTPATGRPFQVTFSAGIAQVKRGMTLEQGIAQADRFLYIAKAAGRDHVLTEIDRVSLKKNILVVEDNDITASIIKRCLEREGLKVIHVKDGQSALAAAAEKSISLISLDVKVPGLDGFELLERFRQIPSLKEVPILMVTSAGKQADIVRGFELGADDYILKPFAPGEYLARAHRFLQKH